MYFNFIVRLLPAQDTRLSGNSRALGFGAEKSTSMGNSLLVLLDITFSCACVDELAKALESDSFDGFFLDSDAITADEGMEVFCPALPGASAGLVQCSHLLHSEMTFCDPSGQAHSGKGRGDD